MQKMSEKEANELIDKLRDLANDTEVDMFCVASLNAYFEESADAIQTLLEEIQQYRALEQRLQSVYGEHDGLLEIIVNGLVKYENAPDMAYKAVLLTDDDVDKWKQYKAIGTVEQCREAVERMRGK